MTTLKLDIMRDLMVRKAMLRSMTLPGMVKNFLRISAFSLCAFFGTTSADDFKSMVIPGDGSATAETSITRVHGDQFMLIRNFTQEDGTTRGVVIVTNPPTSVTPVNVLAAAILDPAELGQYVLAVSGRPRRLVERLAGEQERGVCD